VTRVVRHWKVKEDAVFELPPVGEYKFANTPLAQALVQVRFPIQAKLGTLEGLSAVQERIADRYPYLGGSQSPPIELQIGPEGAQAAVGPGGGYMFNSDDGHSVILHTDSVSLTVGPEYVSFDDFKERFDVILRALDECVTIPRCDRIATRYLTVAPTPVGDEGAWKTWFKAELLGWVAGHELSPAVVIGSAINQVGMSAPPTAALSAFPSDVQAVIRHGLVPGGTAVPGIPPISLPERSYLLDLDVFSAGAQGWDIDGLIEQVVVLHDQIERFFRWSLTPEGEKHFGLEEQQ
jgi:uncharacterized protein (TIGR04255 family)